MNLFLFGACLVLLGVPLSCFFFVWSTIYGISLFFQKWIDKDKSFWQSMLLLYGSAYKSMIPIMWLLSGLYLVSMVYAFPMLIRIYNQLGGV